MDYKSTLKIPKTDFEMKANLNQKEPKIQASWDEGKLYQNLLFERKERQMKVLHDGPPYANGNLHVGHALNKILKDMVVRTWFAFGFNSLYIPGWDTHGLPIEHAVSQKTKNYNHLSISEKRAICLAYAKEQIEIQRAQFKRFGLITNFKNCYYTFDPSFEVDQLNVFASMVKKELIYQDFKPIYWSWSSRSALADAEIEYHDVKAFSIYVSFDIVKANDAQLVGAKLLIWTTTPWTIPSNQAICANPNLEYVLIARDKEKFILAKNRLEAVVQELGWTDYQLIGNVSRQQLSGIIYQHALYDDKQYPLLFGEHVLDDNGSGLVHTAPGFGVDDYYVCKANGINDLIVAIDDAGKFKSDFFDTELQNIFYQDANPLICERLKQLNHLHGLSEFMHSEAHDWRTKKPVIYRATKQWFINLQKVRNNLTQAIETVTFQHQAYKERLSNMIMNRSEWCISRQRVWGVPIPIIYDGNDNPIMDVNLINHIIDKIKEHGTNAWFEQPVEFFLTSEYLDKKQNYRKEQDIMDVWFDSGSSFNVLTHYKLQPQADLYLEGNDQYRGWFNSSIICSTIVNNQAPYKELFSHGITLDEQGRKMSKSVGNVIDPIKICDQYGADILRLWVCSVDYTQDNRIGNNILSQVAEQYRKIRNTLFRYILANINDFDFRDFGEYKYSLADKIVLHSVNKNLKEIDSELQKHNFTAVLKIINKQVIDLSTWYFDLIKDSLYCDATDSSERRAIQSVLNYILKQYLIRLSIIIPYTCQEVYDYYNGPKNSYGIFCEQIEELAQLDDEPELQHIYDSFFKLKDAVYLQIENLRKAKVINKNNEADVIIPKTLAFNDDMDLLKKWLNVAQVKIGSEIKVSKTSFKRCERCWTHHADNYFASADLCQRCHDVISLNS